MPRANWLDKQRNARHADMSEDESYLESGYEFDEGAALDDAAESLIHADDEYAASAPEGGASGADDVSIATAAALGAIFANLRGADARRLLGEIGTVFSRSARLLNNELLGCVKLAGCVAWLVLGACAIASLLLLWPVSGHSAVPEVANLLYASTAHMLPQGADYIDSLASPAPPDVVSVGT